MKRARQGKTKFLIDQAEIPPFFPPVSVAQRLSSLLPERISGSQREASNLHMRTDRSPPPSHSVETFPRGQAGGRRASSSSPSLHFAPADAKARLSLNGSRRMEAEHAMRMNSLSKASLSCWQLSRLGHISPLTTGGGALFARPLAPSAGVKGNVVKQTTRAGRERGLLTDVRAITEAG